MTTKTTNTITTSPLSSRAEVTFLAADGKTIRNANARILNKPLEAVSVTCTAKTAGRTAIRASGSAPDGWKPDGREAVIANRLHVFGVLDVTASDPATAEKRIRWYDAVTEASGWLTIDR